MKNLNELKVVELKEMLRDRGLKVSGRKAELIERLQEFEEAVHNYNETQDIYEGHGAMYDYINSNITEEIHMSSGDDFLKSRIADIVENDWTTEKDLIEYIVQEANEIYEFYLDGGNEHSAEEINDVKKFVEFIENLSKHVEVNPYNEDVEESEQAEEVEEVVDNRMNDVLEDIHSYAKQVGVDVKVNVCPSILDELVEALEEVEDDWNTARWVILNGIINASPSSSQGTRDIKVSMDEEGVVQVGGR